MLFGFLQILEFKNHSNSIEISRTEKGPKQTKNGGVHELSDCPQALQPQGSESNSGRTFVVSRNPRVLKTIHNYHMACIRHSNHSLYRGFKVVLLRLSKIVWFSKYSLKTPSKCLNPLCSLSWSLTVWIRKLILSCDDDLKCLLRPFKDLLFPYPWFKLIFTSC